jgi:hypothetical protein
MVRVVERMVQTGPSSNVSGNGCSHSTVDYLDTSLPYDDQAQTFEVPCEVTSSDTLATWKANRAAAIKQAVIDLIGSWQAPGVLLYPYELVVPA